MRRMWCRPGSGVLSAVDEENEMTGTEGVWLTQDAYERLRRELLELRAAQHGPGDEDGQSAAGRRLRRLELEELLDRAVVGQAPADDGIAEPGMVLTVRFDDEQTETFLLSRRDGADTEELEVYSPESPLGRALTGARPGQVCSYRIPSGASVNVTLLEAVPYGMHLRRR
ncbi:Transcript cleavage factor greA [Nocardia africana]|uniref:Transcript cleavage factor greA n=2 Tax=Nocardia africana TaxID=134964 RepID=A0A378WWC9_9NOCA|nr:Transcript cleavage factor greA [Nocardia africana]